MKKKFSFFIIILFFIYLVLPAQNIVKKNFYSLPKGVTEKDYIPNTIIIKLKPQYRNDCKINQINIEPLRRVLECYGISNLQKKFPLKQEPTININAYGDTLVDLSLIYEYKYIANKNIEEVINDIISTGKVLYAQPHFIQKFLYNPNDPFVNTQYYLRKINAYNAWNLSQGDTNIIIGIVDTGTDLIHPDLQGNIKYNYEDPIDGIDNDNDGFTDNYYGWDLGNNDNNPQAESSVPYGCHGVHVSGISSATTNNGIGIAGVGFKCKFLPVKVNDNSGILTMGYEGIVYAVDHGCSIVNCSWGDTNSAGDFGQDIINYATINMNAIVVASAGNIIAPLNYYPASYNNVLSVGRIDSFDVLTGSYSQNIDICAPGEDIYSTWCGGGYISSGGSSMSAPIISGCAAILKNYFPSYNALQIAEQLKVTADIIDTIAANHNYFEKMGSGRVNLYNAITKTNLPSIRMIKDYTSFVQYGSFTPKDTISLSYDFINYLSPTNNLNVTICSNSPYVYIVDSTVNLGVINTLQTKNNINQPFKLVLLSNTPISQNIQIKFKFTDNEYKAVQFLNFVVNTDYIDIDTNLITTTFTSKGKLGYNDPSYTKGKGFLYNNGTTLMQCGGLLVGNSTSQVSDNIYSANGSFDNDFKPYNIAKKLLPSTCSDLDLECTFSDSLAGAQRLDVLIKHNAYAWNTPADKKYIIYEFSIKNIGLSSLNSLYTGFFVDWQLGDQTKNSIQFDASRKMGYTYPINGRTFTAISLLSDLPVIHYAFDNDGSYNGQTNSIKISDGFTTYEKYMALKTNRNIAGVFINGNDVSDMVSSGPFTLQTNDSIIVAFALIAGDHLADIQSSADAAYLKYHSIHSLYNYDQIHSDLKQNYPNPFTDETTIEFELNENALVDLSIYNIFGEKVATILNQNMNIGKYSLLFNGRTLKDGVYYYSLIAGKKTFIKKMILFKQ